jgi:hypothetical protein
MKKKKLNEEIKKTHDEVIFDLQDNHLRQFRGIPRQRSLQMASEHGHVDERRGAVERQDQQVQRRGRHLGRVVWLVGFPAASHIQFDFWKGHRKGISKKYNELRPRNRWYFIGGCTE